MNVQSTTMIVRVQRALAGEGAGIRLLIYDEREALFLEVDWTAAAVQELLGDDFKGYFRAHITPENALSLDARVEDQSW